MATSGQTNLTYNTVLLIQDAFDELGMLSEGRQITSSMFEKAKRKLNLMLKSWQSKPNINIWMNREATLFLEQGVESYLLGNNDANATENYFETSINASGNEGATSITVEDASGIVDGYYIGIGLDNGEAQWTTVNGTPVANVVNLDDALTDDVSVGNDVISYETKITKPLRLTNVLFVSNDDTSEDQPNDIECTYFDRSEYFRLPNKQTQGSSLQYYYNRYIDDNKLYVWPTADYTFRKLKFTYQPEFDLFVNNGDEPDFMPEWYEALKYNLAKTIAPSYGFSKGSETYETISELAQEKYDDAKNYTRMPYKIIIAQNAEGYY